MSVSEAAASGDRRAVLEAMRANLAARLDDPEERAAAAVARELRLVMAELADGPSEGRDLIDELRARRTAREPGAAGGVGAAKGGKSRR